MSPSAVTSSVKHPLLQLSFTAFNFHKFRFCCCILLLRATLFLLVCISGLFLPHSVPRNSRQTLPSPEGPSHLFCVFLGAQRPLTGLPPPWRRQWHPLWTALCQNSASNGARRTQQRPENRPPSPPPVFQTLLGTVRSATASAVPSACAVGTAEQFFLQEFPPKIIAFWCFCAVFGAVCVCVAAASKTLPPLTPLGSSRHSSGASARRGSSDTGRGREPLASPIASPPTSARCRIVVSPIRTRGVSPAGGEAVPPAAASPGAGASAAGVGAAAAGGDAGGGRAGSGSGRAGGGVTALTAAAEARQRAVTEAANDKAAGGDGKDPPLSPKSAAARNKKLRKKQKALLSKVLCVCLRL